MADIFTKSKRSEIMASVRGRGNKATEWRLRARLIAAGISGWRMNAIDVPGRPDFVFDGPRVVVFIDGCFWHRCERHRNLPATNKEFWRTKILGNVRRDRRVNRQLRASGWRFLRFWEHDLRENPNRVLSRVRSKIASAKTVPVSSDTSTRSL